MAKFRYTGRSATVSVYSTSGGAYLPVGLTRNIGPPAMEKAAIDCTAMEDTHVVVEQGLEQQSSLTFTCLQASTDAADILIQSAYDNETECNWLIARKRGALTWNSGFDGIVTAIRPQAFSGNDPATMEVEVLRTSAITDSSPV